MSRKKNFFNGVASGYLVMGANIIYTMGSIPVALHYLPKEEFGLWALISQLAGYLALLDLGMSTSTARILIDSKDDRNGGIYGSILLTSGLVFATQAALVAIGGCLLGPIVSHLVDLPKQHLELFNLLFAFQCMLLALGFLSRVFGSPLYAHQRYDVSNFAQASQLLISFVALWFGFTCHWGLYSMIFSGLASWGWGTLFQGVASFRLGLFPSRGCWGRPQWVVFHELFAYGKDVFLMGLGWQLLSASQVIIVSRVLGLDAAATWSVCTKMATLAQQFVWRIYDFSCGAFSEMFVRGELTLLKKRFKDILVITASLSVFVGAILALCNAPFVNFWTHGRISWSPLNDPLLGLFLIINSITRCHGGVAGITKKIGFARYIYFLEGVFFICTAFFAAKPWGFSGILLCAIAAELIFPCSYGLFRSKDLFGTSYREMTLGWLKDSGLYAICFMIPLFIIFPCIKNIGGINGLLIRTGLLILTGVPSLWWIGLSKEIRGELTQKIREILPRKT